MVDDVLATGARTAGVALLGEVSAVAASIELSLTKADVVSMLPCR
jgi:hypothetical protein